jgi:hypothetical protein
MSGWVPKPGHWRSDCLGQCLVWNLVDDKSGQLDESNCTPQDRFHEPFQKCTKRVVAMGNMLNKLFHFEMGTGSLFDKRHMRRCYVQAIGEWDCAALSCQGLYDKFASNSKQKEKNMQVLPIGKLDKNLVAKIHMLMLLYVLLLCSPCLILLGINVTTSTPSANRGKAENDAYTSKPVGSM